MIFAPQAKLLRHYKEVANWLVFGKTSPILVEVAPTGFCNAGCPWCSFKNKKSKDFIDTEIMLKALRDMCKIGVKAINWTGGGEPTLHPDFSKFVDTAKKLGFKQGLFTNAYNRIPLEKNFEWIRVSITDKGFKAIKKPKVDFGICVNQIPEHTEKELKQLCIGARKFGAKYFQIRPALVGDYRKQPEVVVPDYLEKYGTKDFKVYVTSYKYEEARKPKEYKECYGYMFCPSVDWFGNVSVCLYLTLNKDFILGSLKEKSFDQICADEPSLIKVQNVCFNCCKNHEINKILFTAKYIKQTEFL